MNTTPSPATAGGVPVMFVLGGACEELDRVGVGSAGLREAIRTVEAMAGALVKAHSLFQQINRDDDGEEYLNLSCDGMDLLEPILAAFESAAPACGGGEAVASCWIEPERLAELADYEGSEATIYRENITGNLTPIYTTPPTPSAPASPGVDAIRAVACEVKNGLPFGQPDYHGNYALKVDTVRAIEQLVAFVRAIPASAFSTVSSSAPVVDEVREALRALRRRLRNLSGEYALASPIGAGIDVAIREVDAALAGKDGPR